MGYKGMMFSDVPNLAIALGYTNASWTLKCDLTCEYVCRLLNHMDAHGYATARRVDRDPSVTREPFIDFSSGYVHALDRQVPEAGVAAPVAAATRTTRATSSCCATARSRTRRWSSRAPARPGRSLKQRADPRPGARPVE